MIDIFFKNYALLNLKLSLSFYESSNTRVILQLNELSSEISIDPSIVQSQVTKYNPYYFYSKNDFYNSNINQLQNCFILEKTHNDVSNLYKINFSKFIVKSPITYIKEFYNLDYKEILLDIESLLDKKIEEYYSLNYLDHFDILKIADFLKINPLILLELHYNYINYCILFTKEYSDKLKPKKNIILKSALIKEIYEMPKYIKNRIKSQIQHNHKS